MVLGIGSETLFSSYVKASVVKPKLQDESFKAPSVRKVTTYAETLFKMITFWDSPTASNIIVMSLLQYNNQMDNTISGDF